jgi:hypothetical protein
MAIFWILVGRRPFFTFLTSLKVNYFNYSAQPLVFPIANPTNIIAIKTIPKHPIPNM